jgi:S1-C subfamily serine protease
MSPEELPGYAHLSRGTNNQALSESNNEYKMQAARDVGIKPLIKQWEDFLNACILPILDPTLAKLVTIQLLGLDALISQGLPTACCLAALLPCLAGASADEPAPQAVIAAAARKVVKLYGAGGLRGLEAYQSGILVSPDGRILTVASTVLDSERLDCVLDDGRRYEARLVGIDPRRELAVLQIEAEDLPCFALEEPPVQDVLTSHHASRG